MLRAGPAARRISGRGTASLEVVLVLPVVFLIFGLLVVMAHGHLVRVRLEGATALASMTYATQRSLGKTPTEADQEARRRIEQAYFPAAQVVSVVTTTGLPTGGNPLSQKLADDPELQQEAQDDAQDRASNSPFDPGGDDDGPPNFRTDPLGDLIELALDEVMDEVQDLIGDGGMLDGALGGLTEMLGDAVLPFNDSRQTTVVRIHVKPIMLPLLFPERDFESQLIVDSTPWTFDEWGIAGQYINKLGIVGDLLAAVLWPTGFVGEVGCYGGDT